MSLLRYSVVNIAKKATAQEYDRNMRVALVLFFKKKDSEPEFSANILKRQQSQKQLKETPDGYIAHLMRVLTANECI